MSGDPGDHPPAASAAVDIEKLADLVYRLLRKDIRLGRARGEALPGDTGRTGSAQC